MRRILVALVLLTGLALADAPVDIFRVQLDNPGHGQFGGFRYNTGGANVFTCYQGTVWFRNTTDQDLQHVQLHVTLFNRHQYVNDVSKVYEVGIMSASQSLAWDFKLYSSSDESLVPVIRVTYELNGAKGEQKTLPSDTYY